MNLPDEGQEKVPGVHHSQQELLVAFRLAPWTYRPHPAPQRAQKEMRFSAHAEGAKKAILSGWRIRLLKV